jgi:putative transcriptional regulator
MALSASPGAAMAEGISRGMLLVASRQLTDPNFAETVVLLVEHNDSGTLGMIINRPTNLRLGKAVPELADVEHGEYLLYFGGPVASRAVNYVTRDQPPGDFMQLEKDVYLGGSRQGLRDLVVDDVARDQLRVFLGYAGWGPGQLHKEIVRGSWHWTRGSAAEVFNEAPEGLWPTLINRLAPEGLRANLLRLPWSESVGAGPLAKGLDLALHQP